MGGRGNHIARLHKPKKVADLFNGNVIVATHKLIIPEEDMRIYGEMKKMDDVHEADFNTVVPTHKWANR
jgi:hypothetical protein